MDKIKVLWMNNGEKISSLITEADEYNIEIEDCKSFTECRKLLSSINNLCPCYDAVIINSFCKILTTEKPQTQNLYYVLDWLGKYYPRIPWFVVTTTKDMEDSDIFQLKMTLKR